MPEPLIYKTRTNSWIVVFETFCEKTIKEFSDYREAIAYTNTCRSDRVIYDIPARIIETDDGTFITIRYLYTGHPEVREWKTKIEAHNFACAHLVFEQNSIAA